MISRFRAAFLGLLLVGFAGVAGAATNDVQINLGPTYPQTIELQDGTNTLSVVIAAQSVLQITNMVVVSEDDFRDIITDVFTVIDDNLFWLSESLDFLDRVSSTNYFEIIQSIDYILAHDADQYHLSPDTRLALSDLRAAAVSIDEDVSSARSYTSDVRDNLLALRSYFEFDVWDKSQTVPVLVYADMTLSPASGGGCDCAEMLGYIYQLLESIDTRVALSNSTLADFKTMVHDYLYAIKVQLNDIQNLLTRWYGDWSDVFDMLALNGLFDLSWDDMQDMIDYLNTVFDQIDVFQGSGTTGQGVQEFAINLARFYALWSHARAVAVTNFVGLSGPVPLLVEISNPVTNDWPLAWAVTNFVDSAGEQVPLLVVEDTDGAMDDMEDRADSLTRSDADITHWERFPTGIDWEDIKRKADFSDFQVDDRPNRIKVVDGYDFSWSWGSESDSQYVDYAYWDLSADQSGFFRYVHDFFKALWYFVVGIFPCIFLFWWAFVFSVRATYFGYALLTGRDTARAFARLGALRGFLGDAS